MITRSELEEYVSKFDSLELDPVLPRITITPLNHTITVSLKFITLNRLREILNKESIRHNLKIKY